MLCRGLGDYFSAGVAGRTLFPLRLQKHTYRNLINAPTTATKQFRYCYDHEIDAVSQATRQIADCEVSVSSRAIKSQRKLNQVANGKLKPIWTSRFMYFVFRQLLDDSTGYLRKHARNVGGPMQCPRVELVSAWQDVMRPLPNVCG